MASGCQKSKFLNPGICPIADCEVTLLLDGQTRLYACKHALIAKCGFFKGLFSADFKEKNSNKVEIKEVSQLDMLFFLECEFGHKSLPSDADSLCALISLADQFMCDSLQERITEHLDTESMFLNLSPDTKVALIREALKHKASCLPLLKTCMRLCANLKLTDVSVLSTQISSGAMVAVYGMVVQAAEHIEWLRTHSPTHECGRQEWRGRANGRFLVQQHEYDESSTMEVNSKQVEVWECSVCKRKEIKETLTYEKVKEFEIDQDKLKE